MTGLVGIFLCLDGYRLFQMCASCQLQAGTCIWTDRYCRL